MGQLLYQTVTVTALDRGEGQVLHPVFDRFDIGIFFL